MTKRAFVIGALILAFTGLVIWFLFQRQAKLSLILNQPFATNIREPFVVSDQEFYFFSGSAFVRYNLQDRSTSPLTPLFSLPNITEVKWSKHGALFHANDYSPLDQLYPVLKTRHLTTDGAYWWLVDFASGRINLVGGQGAPEVVDVTWQADGQSYLAVVSVRDSPRQTVQRFDLAGNRIKQIEVSNIYRLHWSDDSRLIAEAVAIQTDSEPYLAEYSLTSAKETRLVDNVAGNVAVKPDGSKLIYLARLGGSEEGDILHGALMLYSSATRSVTKILEDFSGQLGWSPDGKRWVAFGSGDGQWVFVGNDELLKLKLKMAKGDLPTDLRLAGILSDSLIMLAGTNTAYQATPQPLKNQPTLPSQAPLQTPRFTDQFYITYDPQIDEYSVLILQDPYPENLERAFEYIKSLELDPYQLNIRWIADDGVDRSN